ncbi:MAG: YifB family Mg chelatase-like AAA ATPase [Candidatus Binatia bacterium]
MNSTVTIGSGLVVGVDAVAIAVEATVRSAADGTPRLLGLVDTCVREAYFRVLQAFFALELPAPRGIITVNFAPAALKKHGSGFDLPLALALAGAAGLFPAERTRGLFAFGEVSLRGAILPARGAVSVALAARAHGAAAMLAGPEDAALCRTVPGVDVRGAPTLADAVFWLAGRRELPPPPPAPAPAMPRVPDLADIRGHATPKRALAVAAAGGHNLLFVGPPGSGKSALVRRLPGILPPPDAGERLEIVQTYAAAGLPLPPPQQRPLRAPHHTSSTASLLGGGSDLRPGEVTLAHRGVLFLDELPEFRRDALEAMRQPLEDGTVTVGRALRTATMPARLQLLAAMNPCPCGFRGHPRRPCLCPPPLVQRYHRRLSGPLLDRLDLQVEVPALDPGEYRGPPEAHGATAPLAAAVAGAWQRQRARNPAACRNAELDGDVLLRACGPDAAALDALDQVLRRQRGSGRMRVRLLRVARTLADLRGDDRVHAEDVLEAAALRGAALET